MTIDERLEILAEHLTTLSGMQIKTEENLQRLEAAQAKADRRLNLLYGITLKIGADFAERLRKLEQDNSGA